MGLIDLPQNTIFPIPSALLPFTGKGQKSLDSLKRVLKIKKGSLKRKFKRKKNLRLAHSTLPF